VTHCFTAEAELLVKFTKSPFVVLK